MRRVGRLAVYLVALGFLAAGAGMVGEPLSTGGPMHFDFNLPIGIVYLTCGVALLEWLPAASGWVYVLAALVILSAAGRNFYRYPPIDDGAYFLLRYGRNALDDWTPAQPFAPMLAFAVAGWAVARSLGGIGSRLVRLGVLALGAVICCAVYELFMHGLIAGADPLRLGLLLCSLAAFAAGCGGWANRYEAARMGLGLTAMTVLASLASWGLYLL